MDEEDALQNVSAKLTRSELIEVQNAAAAAGKTVSEWSRDVLLHSVSEDFARANADPILFTEVVGVQLFLMNVLSPITRGERIPPERYQSIIKSVQTNKARAAQEVLAKRLRTEPE